MSAVHPARTLRAGPRGPKVQGIGPMGRFVKRRTHMTDNQSKSINPAQTGGIAVASELDRFLADLRQRRRSIVHKPLARGRLIFGLDAIAIPVPHNCGGAAAAASRTSPR